MTKRPGRDPGFLCRGRHVLVRLFLITLFVVVAYPPAILWIGGEELLRNFVPVLSPLVLLLSVAIAWGTYQHNLVRAEKDHAQNDARAQKARSFDHIIEQTKDRDLILMNAQFKAVVEKLQRQHRPPYTLEQVEACEATYDGREVDCNDVLTKLFNYYEATFIGIELGALDKAIIRQWWEASFIQDWADFSAYVKDKRERYERPKLYEKFENGVNSWLSERNL